MGEPASGWNERLQRIEARLEAIERRLGTAASPLHEPPPQPEAPPSTRPSAKAPQTPASPPEPQFDRLSAAAEAKRDRRAEASPPPPHVPPPRTGPPAPSVATRPPPRRERAHREGGLEGLIGGRVFAVIGAIVVVIGTALFLKYGVEQGWFAIADRWKCILGALFGFALLGAGEVALRRINALASAGLSAAGIGAIYASAWAARVRYELIGDELAFALLAATTALGVIVALRASLLTVAVLSIVGAYLAPFIVKPEAPSPYVLPVYTIAILALGLVLSYCRRTPFRPLRSVVWWGSVVMTLTWTAMTAHDHPLLAGGFYLAFWCAVHAELFFSARRDEGLIFQDEESGETEPTPAGPGYRAVATSFGTTIVAVGLGAIIMRTSNAPISDWFVTAGGFVASICVGLMLAGHLRLIRDVPRTTAQRLGAGLMMQAGALLIATVALALEGATEAAAWLAMGLAAVAAGRWLRARSLDVYGVIILSIAALRLVSYDAFSSAASPWHEIGGLVLSQWMLLMVLAAAAWLAAARLMLIGAGRTWRNNATAAAAIGVALLFLSLVHHDVSEPSLAWVWLALSVTVALARALESRLRLDWIGLTALAPTAGVWLVAWPLPEWTDRAGLVHPGFVYGLVLIGACVGLARWAIRSVQEDDVRRYGWWSGLGVAVSLFLLITSMEVMRGAQILTDDEMVRASALSIWWGVYGVAMIAAGFSLRVPLCRHAGLFLMTVATAKALIIDFADVPELWRIASFIGLGLLMLGVAVAYFKLAAALERGESDQDALEAGSLEGGGAG